MNSLSWFIYFIDIANGLLGMAIIGAFATVVWYALAKGVIFHAKETTEEYYGNKDNFKHAPKWFFLCIFMAVAIPSERTLYMILGSELGEEAVASDTGKRVFDAVNKKLDEYILLDQVGK